MNVSLTPELAKLVDEKVATGMYGSASEVIREALRLLHERDVVRKLQTEALRQQLRQGTEQVERGKVRAFDAGEIKAWARQRLGARKGR